MISRNKMICCLVLAAALLFSRGASSQSSPGPSSKPAPAAPRGDLSCRVTIEVTGGQTQAPVENASVYLKYVEEHTIKRDKKTELNVKTNHEGIAHVPDAPQGRALLQIIAEGWKPYGRWYDINEAKQTIKVHLERPPKWY